MPKAKPGLSKAKKPSRATTKPARVPAGAGRLRSWRQYREESVTSDDARGALTLRSLLTPLLGEIRPLDATEPDELSYEILEEDGLRLGFLEPRAAGPIDLGKLSALVAWLDVLVCEATSDGELVRREWAWAEAAMTARWSYLGASEIASGWQRMNARRDIGTELPAHVRNCLGTTDAATIKLRGTDLAAALDRLVDVRRLFDQIEVEQLDAALAKIGPS
jgi:hypothetical protein